MAAGRTAHVPSASQLACSTARSASALVVLYSSTWRDGGKSGSVSSPSTMAQSPNTALYVLVYTSRDTPSLLAAASTTSVPLMFTSRVRRRLSISRPLIPKLAV